MKKNLRKELLAALICVFCMNIIFVQNVYAEDFNGDLTYDEGARYEEYEEAGSIEYQIGNSERVSLPDRYELPVECFIQENNYYCGPATTKQVLHYINGTSLSQDEYAAALGTTTDGTDMTMIRDVLNANQTKKTYTYAYIGTQGNWELMVKHSTYWGTPAVIDINTSDYDSEFWYNTTGHFVNISGYNYSNLAHEVCITDPNGVHSGNVWYSSDVLYGANNAHFRQAILW